jgi:hypothetical protein
VEFDMDRKNKVCIICLQKLNIAKQNLILISILTLFLLGINIQGTESSNIRKEIVLKSKVGSKDGELGFKTFKNGETIVPSAIAIDSNVNIYIADVINNRVQKFNKQGKFLSKIRFTVNRKSFEWTIDDLATDGSNNLYIASRHEGKIDKYSPERKLLQSINLDDKDIYWDEKKGWVRGAIYIERIVVDIVGNVYLQGFHEIIKFNLSGDIEKKWAGDTPVFFLDEIGNLYLSINKNIWEKYNIKGNKVGNVKCGEMYFLLKNEHCNYPSFVDKNGFLYWFENNNTILIKTDKDGKQYREYDVGPHSLFGNAVKFDTDGNLYILHYSKDGFWIEKISWD